LAAVPPAAKNGLATENTPHAVNPSPKINLQLTADQLTIAGK